MNIYKCNIDHKKASVRSQKWLKALTELTTETKALQQLGLLFCNQINNNITASFGNEKTTLQLPSIIDFIGMDRSKILEMTNKICLIEKDYCQINTLNKYTWAKILGGSALSFARAGDLSVVATLVRLSAHLNLNNPWIDESERFILHQQQPDGSFGLLAPELASQQDNSLASESRLRLTVEILWAFAEREALNP